MIKYASFDVWNTLVKANPEYAHQRTLRLSEFSGKSYDECKAAYTEVKTWIDDQTEKTGYAPTTLTSVYVLMQKLNIHADPNFVHSVFTTLFEAHPPTFIDGAIDTVKALQHRGIKIVIGSNSNFITGRAMHPFLERNLGVIEFGVYSDLLGVGKPSSKFFEEIWVRSKMARSFPEIIHIGDNFVADIKGGTEFGFQTFYVTKDSPIAGVVEYVDNA